MKIVKYFIFLIIIFPISCFAVTREEFNEAVIKVADSTVKDYSDEFVYSFYWGGTPENPINYSYKLSEYMRDAFKGIKTKSGSIYGTMKSNAGTHGSFSNRFPVYCATYVKIMVYHASNGKAQFNYGDNDSYEKIQISELKRGDIIDYKSHVAIFVDDGNDSNQKTWHVIEASGKLYNRVIERSDVEGAFRIKDSVLKTLDYNAITSSYDFHDRLDDYPPIINSVNEISNTDKIQINATDNKHYDLSEKSDVLEPENNGIVAYQVTKTNTIPTSDWKTVTKTNNLSVEEHVNGNGTYYVYVKDVGGNVTSKTVNLTNIVTDDEAPTLGTFNRESDGKSVKVIITDAKDNKGIKEYRYYLNNELVKSTSDNYYIFDDLDKDKEYDFYYEVVDNSENVTKSEVYKLMVEVDAKEINLSEDNLYLLPNDTYILKPKVVIDSKEYTIKYRSSDEKIVTVSSEGEIKAIGTGTCDIYISVGKTTKKVKVRVSTYKIEYKLDKLPEAYIGEEYNVLIETNYDTKTYLKDSELPPGLELKNNRIVGTPKDNSRGEYKIKLASTYLDSEAVIEYKLTVKYKVDFIKSTLKKAYVNKAYNEEIKTNYSGTVSLVKGELPKGINLVNNKLVGTPEEAGEYTFTLKVEYNDSETEQEFVLNVSNDNYFIYIVVIICIMLLLIFVLMYRKKKGVQDGEE